MLSIISLKVWGFKKKNTGTIWYNPVDFLFRPFNLKNYSFNVIYQLFILASNCLHCFEASRDSCLPYNPRFLAALDTCASAAQTFRQRPGHPGGSIPKWKVSY